MSTRLVQLAAQSPLLKRGLLLVPVLLMWAVFSAIAALTIIVQLAASVAYVISGSDKLRDWVTRTGQGTDGLMNASLFGGDPRETVSSHAGRWIVEDLKTPGCAPLWAHIVDNLTGLFEPSHVIKAVEEPFKDAPL